MSAAEIARHRLRNPRLRQVARRCVWWQDPADTLRRAEHFLAHVMTFGLWEDVQTIRKLYSRDELRRALRNAPAGVFDPASWHYWHRSLGFRKIPPLPVRRIPGVEPAAPSSKLTFHHSLRKSG